MGTSGLVLAQVPEQERARELWLQHAAGKIIFEDIRGYALRKLDPALPNVARLAAIKAIDDTVYGLMMVADGVTGALASEKHSVSVKLTVSLSDRLEGEEIERIDLSKGDGMCMGYHGWHEGDFGEEPLLDTEASA
jgi:hypothetical protein